MLDPSVQGDEVSNFLKRRRLSLVRMNDKMSLHSILNNNNEPIYVSCEVRKQKRQEESTIEEPIQKRRRASFDCPLLDTVEHFYGAKRDEDAISALNILCHASNNSLQQQTAKTSPSPPVVAPCGSPPLSSPPKIAEFFSNQWMQRFAELKAFQKHHGHTNVTRTTDTYKSLGNWVAEQRRKHRKGKMPAEQFELLSSIGFEWDRKYYFQPGHSK